VVPELGLMTAWFVDIKIALPGAGPISADPYTSASGIILRT
jgi:hypothetical protein